MVFRTLKTWWLLYGSKDVSIPRDQITVAGLSYIAVQMYKSCKLVRVAKHEHFLLHGHFGDRERLPGLEGFPNVSSLGSDHLYKLVTMQRCLASSSVVVLRSASRNASSTLSVGSRRMSVSAKLLEEGNSSEQPKDNTPAGSAASPSKLDCN